MRPEPGQVLHFSENPSITRFVPHVAATARQAEAYVWAVDAACAPDYWFPRACPRAMAWRLPTTSAADRDRILGPGGGDRVHVIEYRQVAAFLSVDLYAYRFDAQPFRPFGEPAPSAMVAVEAVEPLGPPEPVGNLLELHRAAGIQLRVLDDLWGFWDAVVRSTLGFSGIRLRNAAPRRGDADD
ncbi:hypothetical protein FHR81_003385 [Actinoalloteichus hoggarensis]|uniref:Uncharacterized protein n=1 Tax=Actinoalloteichus hoggarensis TaxID=1470176 RepID=A0A221W8R3_9PSEU|nr:DUF6886 family protein [Actinoalloteichus hoggarensis]ASO21737.1 hypothetical protein AHOG_20600 [Actinoalloteichus hoggarensis]MBB5922333.1 hypothetical protein [Actinoalloteichus hoggarensis]